MCIASQEGSKMAEIAIINPRFEVSYWEWSTPFLCGKAGQPASGSPTPAGRTYS